MIYEILIKIYKLYFVSVTVQDVRLDSTEPHKLLLYWTEPDNIRDSSQVKGGNSYLVRCTSAAMLDGAGDRMVNGSKHCRNRMCTFPIPACELKVSFQKHFKKLFFCRYYAQKREGTLA